MTKHAKKSAQLQIVDLPRTMSVEVPLPLLGVFGNIQNAFFELCIDAGQQVLFAMMEQDREDLCGPRWKRDPERSAGRSGTTRSEVTLGGRRIPIPWPRVRSTEGEEIELPTFAFAASRDPMDRHTLNAVACGISNRKYARSIEWLPESIEERSTSKSSVSRCSRWPMHAVERCGCGFPVVRSVSAHSLGAARRNSLRSSFIASTIAPIHVHSAVPKRSRSR